jgi:hypothetical protein
MREPWAAVAERPDFRPDAARMSVFFGRATHTMTVSGRLDAGQNKSYNQQLK